MFSYYSTHGHVEKLAREIERGAASVEGVEAKLWQACKPFHFHVKNITEEEKKRLEVPETLSEEILGKMGAPAKSDVPIIKVWHWQERLQASSIALALKEEDKKRLRLTEMAMNCFKEMKADGYVPVGRVLEAKRRTNSLQNSGYTVPLSYSLFIGALS
ncbi:hypothetical protein VNO78_03692 [Psophocarpus tetragonolobus]|uniref:Uncharacterized protein n=1 Tax=Psophocarpus tetragonolobus TaxID=3891 RepID=A0AAN9TDP7_PSOTE